MPDRLLTMAEAAKYLGTSEDEVKGLVTKGKLTAYKIGGTFLRFKSEQIEAVKNIIRPSSETYKPTQSDRLIDFLYFNDFYIITILVIIGLIAIILFF